MQLKPAVPATASANVIIEQTELEHLYLKQVKEALRLAIGWQVNDPDSISRKQGSVRFVAQSLNRYMERLFSLEENDGYMSAVVESHPESAGRVNQLLREHEQLRATMRQLLPQLERITPDDRAQFEQICDELLALMKRFSKHNKEESNLLQSAFLQDDGGEG